VTTLSYPAAPLALPAPARVTRPLMANIPSQPGDWKYQTVSGRGFTLAMGMVVAALGHVVFLYGFNQKPPPRAAVIDDTPAVQMVMPDLKEEEEPPPTDLTDLEEPPAGVAVPTLAEYITTVPVDAFVQPMSFTPPAPGDLAGAKLSAIPVHYSRGTGKTGSLGEIFKLSDLDRQPTAVFQAAPAYPFEMKRTGIEGSVNVEFIVDSTGAVVHARALSSTDPRFEEAAVMGVLKWKFRPGMKAGRKVNSRMMVPIKFTIVEE
jgi:protein TonB